MKYLLPTALALALALSLTACGTRQKSEAPVEEAPHALATSDLMEWPDLLEREQPKPDETIEYGKDPLQVIDIWKPAGKGAHPAVIMIHGGCWQTDIAERDIMNWIADDLRKNGVGVWNIEYRGVDRPGGGYPGTYEDVALAADMFVAQAEAYNFRTDKIITMGHSAGGQLALWLANRPVMPAGPLRGETPVGVDLAISQGGLPDLRDGMKREDHPCGTDAPEKMSGGEFSLTSPPEMKTGKARQVLFNNTLDKIAPPAYGISYAGKFKDGKAIMVETEGEGHVELVAPDSQSWAKQRALILKEFGLE